MLSSGKTKAETRERKCNGEADRLKVMGRRGLDVTCSALMNYNLLNHRERGDQVVAEFSDDKENMSPGHPRKNIFRER